MTRGFVHPIACAQATADRENISMCDPHPRLGALGEASSSDAASCKASLRDAPLFEASSDDGDPVHDKITFGVRSAAANHGDITGMVMSAVRESRKDFGVSIKVVPADNFKSLNQRSTKWALPQHL